MVTRACVFIDGENLRHSIVEIFEQFTTEQYLPKRARWAEFFDWLVTVSAGPGARRVRAYWYVVGNLDFWPYKFPKEDDKRRDLISKNPRCKERIQEAAAPEEERQVVETIIHEMEDQRHRIQKRFDGFQTIHRGISSTHSSIEFRAEGFIVYDLYNQNFRDEKGTDVKLAVDMVELAHMYDVAILVSADQDYIPAVKVLKDKGKRVVNVSFQGRDGRLFPGDVWRMNSTTDDRMVVEYERLKSFLNIDAYAPGGQYGPAAGHGHGHASAANAPGAADPAPNAQEPAAAR